MPMQLSLETWSSSDNRHERHYFLKDGQPGAAYQDGKYVFGYNPDIVSADKVQRILAIINE